MRIATRIYTLHIQSKDEVMYTYKRIFKYLSELLTQYEFQQLSFYSVNRMIDQIFTTKIVKNVKGVKKTLRNFLYDSLDLNYMQTEKSHALLNRDEHLKACFANKIWHESKGVDVGALFNASKMPVQPHIHSRSNLKLHNQLDGYVNVSKRVKDAHEFDLHHILEQEYFSK